MAQKRNESPEVRVLLLDAMGVIYAHGDDVGMRLVPWIREHGGTVDRGRIRSAYVRCSLGETTTAEFWEAVGVMPRYGIDTAYTDTLRLTPGILDLIKDARPHYRVACLSNDASPWSRLLRKRFALNNWISDWFISGDTGLRKPDPRAYENVLKSLGVSGHQCLFVDDRQGNLAPAAELGMRVHHFNSTTDPTGGAEQVGKLRRTLNL